MKPIISVASLFIVVMGGEIGTRIHLNRGYRLHLDGNRGSENSRYIMDVSNCIEYRLSPNKTWTWGEFKIVVNSDGIRGPEIPAIRDPAETRILHLGDSFTFGWSVRDDQTISASLDRILAAKGVKCRNINLGVIGYNLTQYRQAFMERLHLARAGDVVVINIFVNDGDPPGYGTSAPNPRNLFGRFDSWFINEGIHMFNEALKKEGEGYRLILPHRKHVQLDAAVSFDPSTVNGRHAVQAYVEMVNLCRERSLSLVTVSHPLILRTEFSDKYLYEGVDRTIEAWAAKAGSPFVDMTRAFLESREDPAGFVHKGDGHYNAKGNEFTAKRISTELLKILSN